MDADKTSRDAFGDAVEERTYEKSTLPDALRRKVDYLEEKAEREKDALRKEQERTREQDLEKERARLRLEHPAKTYEDLTPDAVRKPRSAETIERLAIDAVDKRNALALSGIDLERDEKIDKVFALNRDMPSTARDASHQSQSKSNLDIGGDFYRVSGPEFGSPDIDTGAGGRER